MNLYTKYSKTNSITISYDEILNDFCQIKPTFNPILDICTIKTFGSYITNKINYEQWQICPNLTDEICMIHVDKIQDIVDIIKQGSSKNEKPSYTINKVYYFVSDTIKADLTSKQKDLSSLDVSKYFEMKSKYNESLDQIKLKYTDCWNDIEKQYENIGNILIANFSELENDVNFETTIELIDSIGNEASKKIDVLIKRTATLLKDTELTLQITNNFNKQMDEIYEQVVLSKKFDKVIHDIMIDMFGVEKEIHKMSLSLLQTIEIVRQI